MHQLRNKIASLLPTEFLDHCTVGNLKEGILVLIVRNPTWKHQVNFIKMDLLEKLRTIPIWSGIKSISVVIDCLAEELDQYKDQRNDLNKQTNNKRPVLSATTSALINRMIDEDIKDQKLYQTFKSFIAKIS